MSGVFFVFAFFKNTELCNFLTFTEMNENNAKDAIRA